MMLMRDGAWGRGAMMLLMGYRSIMVGVVGVLLCACGERKQAAGVKEEVPAVVVEVKKTTSVVSSFRVKRTNEEARNTALFYSDAVVWANESMVLATAGNGRVQAFDVKSGKEIWKAEFGVKVAGIACSARHVYVALNSFRPVSDREWLRRLEMATGKDDTPPAIPQPGIVRGLVWDGGLGQLCVVEDKNVSLYTQDLMSVKKRIPYDGMLPFVTTDGASILLTPMGGNCRVVDVKAGTAESVYEPPSLKSSERISRDGPMLVDAFYHASEGRLIRNVDTPKGTARLFIHESPGSAAKEVETGNDHAKAAVSWPTQRVAVAGTSLNLQLFSTKGEVMEEVKDAMTGATAALAFSQSGKQLAVLDAEGWVRVFEVP